jgi:hypothetical protein
MLAALTLFGLRDIWLMNSVKMLLSALMNASAAVTFVIAGVVHWQWTAVVALVRSLEAMPGYMLLAACQPIQRKVLWSGWGLC